MAKRTFDLGAELRKAGGPTVDTREQIEYIPLDRIDPDPENFYSLDGLDELAGSIELVGLQQPLRVRDGERGHVIVVSGHRRRAACMLIRDGGSDMFKAGVPCIREKPDGSKEMQELRLIFANSQTRVLTGAEISRQAERVTELLYRLQDQGVVFPGRMRDHVAEAVNTSKSRIGRLHAIREKLVPELLTKFDAGRLGETVAYRLSQEDRTTQLTLVIKLGPAVQDLTKDTVEKVIEQVKKPAGAGMNIIRPQETEDDGRQIAAPTDEAGAEYSATDGLKKYLDERADEDLLFWMYMQEAADDLIKHSFAAGALPNRKDNIDMLKLDCRTGGSYNGSDGSWSGNNKGIRVGVGVNSIERTWTEAYDALTAIAISRWRAVLTEERRPKKPSPEPPPVFVPIISPEWRTGEPSRDGRYLCRVDMELNRPHEQTCEYKGGVWECFGRPIGEIGKVVSWWPLPDRG